MISQTSPLAALLAGAFVIAVRGPALTPDTAPAALPAAVSTPAIA